MQVTRSFEVKKILDGAAAAGVGATMSVEPFRFVSIDLNTSGSATATVKFQASLMPFDTPPDFSTGPTAANSWFYIHSFDMATGTGVAGGTGYSASGTDIVKGIAIDLNNGSVNWLNAEVSGYTGSGKVNVTAYAAGNQ